MYLFRSFVIIVLLATRFGIVRTDSVASSVQCGSILDRVISLCRVIHTNNDLGDNLPVDKRIQRLNETHVLFPGKNTTCFMAETVDLELDEDEGYYMGVYNVTQYHVLEKCDVIIGPYLSSISSYSFHKRKIYLSTTPLPLQFEHMDRFHSYLFGMWPSYHTFLEAVNLFIKFRTTNEKKQPVNVFILRHCETMEATNYAYSLYSSLSKSENVRHLDEYSFHSEMKKFEDLDVDPLAGDRIMEIYNMFYFLREKMMKEKYEVIILLVDVPDAGSYIRELRILFSKEADLDSGSKHWLIPDVTFGHRKEMLEFLPDVHVIRSRLTFIQQKRYNECQQVASGVQYRGEQFAVNALGNAFSNIARDQFSVHTLWQTIKEQRTWPLNFLTSVFKPVVPDGTYPRHVMMSFVDYRTTTHHGNCLYSTQAIYMDFFHPKRNDVGQINGKYEVRYVNNDNDTAFFYGLVPIDAELEALILVDAPFIMEKESGEFEGIVMDIFQEIRKVLMSSGIILNMKFRRVDSYGERIGNKWNGAFGMLADSSNSMIALGQISITEERKKDFDFSPPIGFINRRYLIRKQEKDDLYFQFARPFTGVVWLGLLLIVIVSAIYIFLLDRWNPFRDFVPPQSRFNAYESVWYSYLTLCHLSAPFAARNLPIQIFSIFYWFFSMIVVGSYTGNLASSLTDAFFLKPKVSPDIRMLPAQSEYRFGCIGNTSVADELETVISSTGESLYDIISRRGDFVANYVEGIERVRKEKFILIGTSGVMSHARNTDPECALELNSQSYYDSKQIEIGFPMKKNWVLKDEFISVVAYLKETGKIAAIYNRWQKQGACESAASKDGHFRLDLKSLTGLYVMLPIAIALSYGFLGIKLLYLKITRRATIDDSTEMKSIGESDDIKTGSHASSVSKLSETPAKTKKCESSDTKNVAKIPLCKLIASAKPPHSD